MLDSRHKFIVNQIKNNLTYNIIQSISKLGFSFQETQTETNNIEIKGVEISSLLEKKALKGFLESKNLSIFTTNQLIEEEGNKLLFWQQICMLRGRKAKGCKPNWFKAIEEILLKNKATREVIKEFKLESKNLEAIKARKQKISKDKRRKEWLITKGENATIVGRINKKFEERFSLIHWKLEEADDALYTQLIKCSGCNLGRRNNLECIVSKLLNK